MWTIRTREAAALLLPAPQCMHSHTGERSSSCCLVTAHDTSSCWCPCTVTLLAGTSFACLELQYGSHAGSTTSPWSCTCRSAGPPCHTRPAGALVCAIANKVHLQVLFMFRLLPGGMRRSARGSPGRKGRPLRIGCSCPGWGPRLLSRRTVSRLLRRLGGRGRDFCPGSAGPTAPRSPPAAQPHRSCRQSETGGWNSLSRNAGHCG